MYSRCDTHRVSWYDLEPGKFRQYNRRTTVSFVSLCESRNLASGSEWTNRRRLRCDKSDMVGKDHTAQTMAITTITTRSNSPMIFTWITGPRSSEFRDTINSRRFIMPMRREDTFSNRPAPFTCLCGMRVCLHVDDGARKCWQPPGDLVSDLPLS